MAKDRTVAEILARNWWIDEEYNPHAQENAKKDRGSGKKMEVPEGIDVVDMSEDEEE